jgi:glycosyltransferase involved in cell wall biosynthesis
MYSHENSDVLFIAEGNSVEKLQELSQENTMTILMIAPEPFLEPRGTPISVLQRLQALSNLGYTIDLVTYHVGQDVDIPGVQIHRIPSVPFVKSVKTGPSYIKPFLDFLLFFKAFFLLLRTRYKVIHSHEEASFFSVILAFIFRTQHVYDMHSSLPRQLENFNFGNNRLFIKLFELLELWVLRTCSAVITIGSDLAAYVEGVNPEVRQLHIGNLALHTNQLPPSQKSANHLRQELNLNNELLIVYTGSFEHYQGIGLLLESATIVKSQYPDVCFVLVGGKPDQLTEWREFVHREQLENQVRFAGIVPPGESLAYLEIADVLVSPRIEGTSVPLKIYSYLQAGKPIVATKIEAHTQVLNENVASLVEPTAPGFAIAILELLEDNELRQCKGEYARQLSQDVHNPAEYEAKMAALYDALIPRVEPKAVR